MTRLVQQQSSGSARAQIGPRAGGSRLDLDRRQRIVLSCAGCGGRNYRKTKARRDGTPPLLLSKFCNICNAHTPHREAV